jgi:hypothetical protein
MPKELIPQQLPVVDTQGADSPNAIFFSTRQGDGTGVRDIMVPQISGEAIIVWDDSGNPSQVPYVRAVSYDPQTLDVAEQNQARTNISAASSRAYLILDDWQFQNNVAPPTANGNIRVNNANQTLVTMLWLTRINGTNRDMTELFNMMDPGDVIRIQDENDGTRWVRYILTDNPIFVGAIGATGSYAEIFVRYDSGPGTIANNQVCAVTLRGF